MEPTELAGNLIIKDGKILLIYRDDHNYWEVPGGKVEDDESPTEAAVRRAREEIGVKVELRKPFYSGEFQHDDQLFLWHCYLAEIIEGEPEIQEDSFDGLEWVKPEEIDGMELAPSLEMILPGLRKV
ncbi:MAG: 8-oxo-dGTP diphosphatase [Candidatus Nanohaloarchaea archaeon]|jgi:8-oxo-dGTP diphosphatase